MRIGDVRCSAHATNGRRCAMASAATARASASVAATSIG